MSVATFFDEYTRKTEPLNRLSLIPPMYRDLIKDHRLYDGNTELHCEANGDAVQLDFISTKIGGHGHGSEALQFLANLADKHAVTVVLKIDLTRVFDSAIRLLSNTSNTQSLTPHSLELWYRRYGFRTVERNDERAILERLPSERD